MSAESSTPKKKPVLLEPKPFHLNRVVYIRRAAINTKTRPTFVLKGNNLFEYIKAVILSSKTFYKSSQIELVFLK